MCLEPHGAYEARDSEQKLQVSEPWPPYMTMWRQFRLCSRPAGGYHVMVVLCSRPLVKAGSSLRTSRLTGGPGETRGNWSSLWKRDHRTLFACGFIVRFSGVLSTTHLVTGVWTLLALRTPRRPQPSCCTEATCTFCRHLLHSRIRDCGPSTDSETRFCRPNDGPTRMAGKGSAGRSQVLGPEGCAPPDAL